MVTPLIADVERRIAYSPVASAGPFSVPFPLFDPSGTDLYVTLNDNEVANWTLTAGVEPGFYGAPTTFTNGVITFSAPITGSLVIEGRRAPRRIAQFAEGRGIPARDQNTEWNILTAIARELFDRMGRLQDYVASTLAGMAAQIAAFATLLSAQLAQAVAYVAEAAGWASNAEDSAQAAAGERASIQFILGMALDDGVWGEPDGLSLDDGVFGT